MTNVLSRTALDAAVAAWLAEGKRVAGPVRHGSQVRYEWITDVERLELDGFVRPANSIKPFVFPPHEVLFQFEQHGRKVELKPTELPSTEQILLAARPCDAAALALLDCVFNWDSRDAFYNNRRRQTTVVTSACPEHDAFCFCTSVGFSPEDSRGSDAMLVALGGGEFELRIVTEKGRRLLAELAEPSERTGQADPGPPPRFELAGIERFLADGFDDPIWRTASLRCIGCGSCAHQCPTCHCFDIVDEVRGKEGQRVRNWDSCQTSLYSLHASGHNPRADQAARQRNRVMHKYRVYPQKFGEVLCTGCGACTRNCPVGLGVQGLLESIAVRQGSPVQETVS